VGIGITYHKVALDVLELARKTLLGSIGGGTVNLIVVVVETGDVSASELGNLASGSTNTTANIEHLHAFLDAHGVGEVVFMTRDGLVERLTSRESTKVERLTPAVLIQIRGQIVVAS
jgi:hypothetical protein